MPIIETERAKRADAVRNRDAILDAALRRLTENPAASMAEIAQAAGVGRVTLYGHFSSREDLVDAVFQRTIAEADAQLERLDLSGNAALAMERLVGRSWRIVAASQALLSVAEQALGAERIRMHHHRPMERVAGLIKRGQAEGSFRGDQPIAWLTTCFHTILHAGAAAVRSGQMTDEEAARVIPETVAAVLLPGARPPRGRSQNRGRHRPGDPLTAGGRSSPKDSA
jgi:AcrR family transcriptional regulator